MDEALVVAAALILVVGATVEVVIGFPSSQISGRDNTFGRPRHSNAARIKLSSPAAAFSSFPLVDGILLFLPLGGLPTV